jgi:aldehyde dehydrogenase (NAD+)
VAAYGHWIGGKDHAPSSGDRFVVHLTTGAVGSSRWRWGPTSRVVAREGAFAMAGDFPSAARPVQWMCDPRMPVRSADRDLAERQALNEMVPRPGSSRLVYYYGGLADKIEGRVIPLDRTSVLNYAREPLGGRRDHAVESPLLTIMAVARRSPPQYRGDRCRK